MRKTPQIEILMVAAKAFGQLLDEFIFVGGAVVDLLISDPQAPMARPTNDIDVIVELTTTLDYYRLAERLRSAGFREDDRSSVICRWLIKGLIVDVMPTSDEVLGFGNRWYLSAARAAH